MVYAYISSLTNYTGSPVNTISNINKYIFDYLYINQKKVDSVLIADKEATLLDQSYSSAYLAALWSRTKFSTTLFKNASHALAELIYTAWTTAGSPPFGAKTMPNALPTVLNESPLVFPNPSSGNISIKADDLKRIEIYSIAGVLVSVQTENQFNINNLSNGIYLFNIYGENALIKREKVMLMK
jgi:hypothetical protein